MKTIKQLKKQIKKLEIELDKRSKKCKHRHVEIQHVISIDGFDSIPLKICKACGFVD